MNGYMIQSEEISRLKDELWQARFTIINLMPEDFRSLLQGYYSCENRDESYRWRYDVVNEILELTRPSESNVVYVSEKAYCPLCGDGTTSYTGGGFTYPEGLKRHLEGFGNTHQCSVVKEVFNLARDHWNEKFREQELIEQKEKEELIAKRMKSETLYKVCPDDKPELIGNGYSWKESRNETELEWAESRVSDLGFTIQEVKKVKTYIRDCAESAVFADVRTKGRIDFYVYKKPFPKRKSRCGRSKAYLGIFYLQDSWKKDLMKKFETRYEKILRT